MFGVDYYPEQWPRQRWKSDARLMRQAGLKAVRLAEFAWEKIEPDDGIFDFSWLDDAIELLRSEGLQVVLGTPTAASPAWLVEKYPQVLPVRSDGTRLGFGGRNHNCQSNDIFRESVEIVVRAMASHYRERPGVVGWQIDNELGNSHLDLCYCESCGYHFRGWLKRKYGTINALNEAWGTVFWSQTYAHFTQIPVPLATPNVHNPALLLDWKRFASDLVVDFQRVQASILRTECPDHFITHNFMGFHGKVDYFHLGNELDFVSHDQYPIDASGRWGALPPAAHSAMPLDFIRGVRQTRFWIMEQQVGAVAAGTLGPTPRPGQARLWAAQSVARGAESVFFFRWRTSLFGAEQLHDGILPHSGDPGRRYHEITETVRDLSPIVDRLRAQGGIGAKVAILFSYDQYWAIQTQPHHPDLSYVGHIGSFYNALHRMNVPVDFVGEHHEYSHYDVVIAPMLFIARDDLAAKLDSYVAGGGHLVLTFRSGVKDKNNRALPETLPGPFAKLLGVRITEHESLRNIEQSVRYGDATEPVSLWADAVEPTDAEAIGLYTRDFYTDAVAVSRRDVNDGAAYYVGTQLGPDLTMRLMRDVVEHAGLKPPSPTPEGVEAVVRLDEDGLHEVIFLLNHTDRVQILDIPSTWRPILLPEGSQRSGGDDEDLLLPAFGVALFETAAGDP